MFALIKSGKVVATNKAGFGNAVLSTGDEIIEVKHCEVGQLFVDGVLVDNSLEKCKCSLDEIRWNKQNLGVTIDGVFLLTDGKSKYEMGNYVLEKTNNGLLTVNWQLSDGTVKKYPITEFIKCYNIIVNYINDCFGVVGDKHIELDASADPATVNLETGWPSREFTTI